MAEPLSTTVATAFVAGVATGVGQKVGDYAGDIIVEETRKGWERHDNAVDSTFNSSKVKTA